jgi:D-glycero-D-manno-heptose 1,7-bisphosphate phosphatase
VPAAAFLDRDGVLNAATVIAGRPHPPANLAEVVILPGVVDACRRLRDAGLQLIVVTNQPDIARGAADAGDVDEINAHLAVALGLDAVLVCPHDNADGCSCRKPRPGLLLRAATQFGIDLDRSVMVGDRWRDVVAGQAAGVRTVFVDRGYDEPVPDRPDLVVGELIDAVPFIVDHARTQEETQ